ncbi:hypothetical protein [Oceanobacillus sp. E9]|uniref:hypothetical protein n=1 Tax=Oceanobacillus sp. E9 TaxID=1742575 RepID=UPI000A60E5C5|nr:hypothetical protein [Oceanobacillus sp. E9]
MNVHIEEVTKENWREIATLSVGSHQQHLVESVLLYSRKLYRTIYDFSGIV